MEHIPFLSFPDGLEITFSHVKQNLSGSEYVTIYFEQPRGERTCSAQYDFPGGHLENVTGFMEEDQAMLLYHIDRIGDIAFDLAREKDDSAVEALHGCASNLNQTAEEIRAERRDML